MGKPSHTDTARSTPEDRKRVIHAFDDLLACLGYHERGRYSYVEVKRAYDEYREACRELGEPAFALCEFGEMTSIPRNYPQDPVVETLPIYENQYFDTPYFQEFRVRRDAVLRARLANITDDDLAQYMKRQPKT